MRRQARLTSKGQITIPHDIRRLLGVRPGDSLLFDGDETDLRLRPVKINSPFAKYRGIGNPAIGSGRKAIVD